MTVPLVLASASPRRRELLALLGLSFETHPTGVDETLTPGADSGAEVRRLASLKATAAFGAGTAIGADTLVVLDGRPLGKPSGDAEAAAMLRALRGREHQVVTGVAVRCGGWLAADVAATSVWMREYRDLEIAAFVASGAASDKAGAYAIQGPGFHPVDRIAGCYCNVVGLPLGRLARLLRATGCLDRVPEPPETCRSCPDWE